MPGPWIIDTDPAIGLPYRDIDDALAIHAMVRSGVGVVGLTTAFGNAPLPRVHAVAEALGRRYELPVWRGAAGPGDVATPAVDRLVAHTGGVLGIGPCTNIAAALARGARWSELVLLGGTERRSPNVRYLHPTELNFALDTHAAQVALGACTTLFAMELCRRVVFTAEHLAGLPADLVAQCQGWLSIAPRLTGTAGFHPWDLLPALHVAQPGLFRVEPRVVRLGRRWPFRGRIDVEPPRASDDAARGGLNVGFATNFSAPELVRCWRSVV